MFRTFFYQVALDLWLNALHTLSYTVPISFRVLLRTVSLKAEIAKKKSFEDNKSLGSIPLLPRELVTGEHRSGWGRWAGRVVITESGGTCQL